MDCIDYGFLEEKNIASEKKNQRHPCYMNNAVSERIHVLFFPFMAHGHMIPVLDMMKLFSSRGADSTILTTPSNSKVLDKTIEAFKNQNPDLEIRIKIFDFPCVDLGLPEGCDDVDFISSYQQPGAGDLLLKLFLSTKYMKQQLESFIEATKPSCLVADMFFPWATESAEKFGVPRLVFHGTSFFSLCCFYNMSTHKPHLKVATNSTPFVIPDLPGDIVMTAEQANVAVEETPMGKIMKEIGESESSSFGVLVNSFYELESAYADFYPSVVAKRAWHIGPLSLCNREFAEKLGRGLKGNVDEQKCLKWLETKTPGSVVYVSFGSGNNFTNEQLLEIAAGLEGSGQNFIWVVVKKKENHGSENEEWLPEGYEERTKGKGLIIRGWAPQVMILEHKAVGGFVTHCGWNSAIEGIAAGLPMVTWPKGAEQFYNKKLLTKVLRIGVNVGATELVKKGKLISREEVEKAVREVISGEEAEERRIRAKKLGEMAKVAVEEGGSSYNDLNRLMEELSSRK